MSRKIVGLDNLGGSPGFDVVNVRALPQSIQPTSVPEPSTIIGLGVLGTFCAGTGFKHKLAKAKKK
ncbi:MAG: PEP-CTERM sorting domain-containing protein [Sphaerospermopsis sp. SIO1G1]|nr:PEP-CTERM sorting domain-containing protein [Sphaerospermopsis sp. SIO1G1]